MNESVNVGRDDYIDKEERGDRERRAKPMNHTPLGLLRPRPPRSTQPLPPRLLWQPRGSPLILPPSQVCGKTRRHAELCFLDWFHVRLSPDEYYRVTWFISWSPCSYCAREVADFMKQYRNVKLSIFAARLYYCRDHAQGLRSLCSSGAQLAIMFFWDFTYCWDNFVHNSGREFSPWKKINVNSRLLATKLEDILK
nr:PREDICTED: DNA dC->dU-editing enzyme APOBEC-3C-like [Equus przewalskii]